MGVDDVGGVVIVMAAARFSVLTQAAVIIVAIVTLLGTVGMMIGGVAVKSTPLALAGLAAMLVAVIVFGTLMTVLTYIEWRVRTAVAS